ncbi:YqjD family protein [Microbulbifer sp. THAF38]|uniref:DUF883 family protein n=1 Tax=Microbulbifer sp. THAF38 TaxID=2587856 RepID=UPI00126872DB|nr:DUF883 C-terminal domain-containing protein [Microbulbifer sp. THAF38]QFT55997.1 hypothetical protein FIU95_15715 [Microbulbifer sp. THAF38]
MATAANSKNANKSVNGKDVARDEAFLSEMARERAHSAVDSLSDRAAVAEERIRETATSSSDSLAQKRDQLKETASQTRSEVEGFAKKNPWAAAGIAFATGAIVSALIRRR